LSRKGGVTTLHNGAHFSKCVKYIKENILISTFRKFGTVIIIFNCYIPPGTNEEIKNLVKTLKGHLKRNRDKFPKTPLIVGGDFNSFYEEIKDFMCNLGYDEAFKNTKTFKRSGN
jgi:hypothetical protein